MKFSNEIEAFIKDYVNDLTEGAAAIFAGAGMSKSVGFVNWPELLTDIATELGLSIDKEHDLISLAQYHVNENNSKAKITKKILQEFSEQAEPSLNHKIIARLPINTYWTTNYDTLIEDSLKEANRIADIKHETEQLAVTRPKRDAVVYKMHGDVNHASKAVITKEQYQAYYKTHEHFITALSGDLLTKTFLFIGFSFTDPNLDYVLGRLSINFGKDARDHYCFLKKVVKGKDDDEDIFKYNIRKQELMINDLKRYHIKALVVDDYPVITQVLEEIENRFKKKTVFISGSAEIYGTWGKDKSQGYIHLLSKNIITNGFSIVNGFGWGVGSAVINGALDAIYSKPEKYSQDQLIVRPFPQFETGKKKLPELWEEYRQNMISLAGIIIIVFGNKSKDGKIVLANGVKSELDIAVSHGLLPIPVPETGYMAKEIFDEIMAEPDKYYKGVDWILPLVKKLNDSSLTEKESIDVVIDIIQKINK
jgi:hypothetical protein